MNNSKDALRDRYLQLWLHVVNNQPNATFEMHGGTTVEGQLCGTDMENNRFRINQLQSPMGTYDKAVIRGSDLNTVQWKVV